MNKDVIEKIKKSRLMEGVQDVEKLLTCFDARKREFLKGEEIVGYGDSPSIVIITKGSAMSLNEDWFGNRNVISRIKESGIFGAAYVYSMHEITTRLVASEDVEAVFIDGKKLHAPCAKNCADHTQFLYNNLSLISRNCVSFLEKTEHLSGRSIRNKVLAYLTSQAVKHNANSFHIPFSRQELADYLAVDRSALSAELGKMKREGLIDFKKANFTIIRR